MIDAFFYSWCGSAIIMLFAWFIYLYNKNPGTVDSFWSIAIMCASLIFIYPGISTGNVIIVALMLVWGVRLSSHLITTRLIKQHIDKRYLELSQNWKIKKNIGFFINYQFQAVFSVIIALPFYFLKGNTEASIFTILSCIVIIIGIIGETIADNQLKHFKKSFKGRVCNIGLWKYSRHPNYFFEWLIWVGFSVSTFDTIIGVYSIISPILLLFIMLKITGPITEDQSIQSRGSAYLDYQKKTSMFFLWFRKKDKQ